MMIRSALAFFLLATFSTGLILVSACGEDSEYTVTKACEEICSRLNDLCGFSGSDITECHNSCNTALADSTEDERHQAMDCVSNAPNCEQAMTCENDQGSGDITVEMVIMSNCSGAASATGYLAFFDTKQKAEAAAESGVGCAEATHSVTLSSVGQTNTLRGVKNITLPQGTYYVIGFADCDGNTCINENDRVTSYAKTFPFEDWMITETELARTIEMTAFYPGSGTTCPQYEQCGTTPDVDTAITDNAVPDETVTDDTVPDETVDTEQPDETVDTEQPDEDTGGNKGVASVTVNSQTVVMYSTNGWQAEGVDSYYGYWYADEQGYSLTMYAYPSVTDDVGTLSLSWGSKSYDNNEESHPFNASVTWSTTTGAGTFSGTLESPVDYSTIEVSGTFEADRP